MPLKAALLALAVLIAWMVLFRPRPRRRDDSHREKLPPRPQELEACPRCGVFRLPGGACDCDHRSTSGD